MNLDTSAVVAMIREELGCERLFEAMDAASRIEIGAATVAEAAIVLVDRYGRDAEEILSRFLDAYEVVTIPFSGAHWHVVAEARLRFGKGRHPARLNFGDCLSYASAKVADQPLLFVGDDFPKTDIAVA